MTISRELPDGSYGLPYEVNGKRPFFEIYTDAQNLLCYNYLVNEKVLVKGHRANIGETRKQLYKRLEWIFNNSNPVL